MKTFADVMVHCTTMNYGYMRLPGKAKGFDAVANLYKCLAVESLSCALAWQHGEMEPPEHEPAVEAFWWGVVAWADAFGRCLDLDEEEWYSKFVAPHRDFAWYLRPYQRGVQPPEDLLWRPLTPGGPWGSQRGWVILELDARWTALVIKLTARWGLWHHLKDLRALWQALRLMRELRAAKATARAYLESDIHFFRKLFEPFDFSEDTRLKIEGFLLAARPTRAYEEGNYGAQPDDHGE